MSFRNLAIAGLVAAGLSVASSAQAAVIVLDFEGLLHGESIGDFYNGGTGGNGSGPGPNYGVTFSGPSLACKDSDVPGGGCNIANEPSPNNILFFLDADQAIMTFAAGFDTGFSLFYAANPDVGDGLVTVYDGVNGTGNVLGSFVLDADLTPLGGCGGGDPNGQYSCWQAVGIAFNGIARSVSFGGAADFIGFDNVTFGSQTPGDPNVPEPATMMLIGAGIGAGLLRRRSRK